MVSCKKLSYFTWPLIPMLEYVKIRDKTTNEMVKKDSKSDSSVGIRQNPFAY
jgi:hypothetical protein